jgi:hypothetical protein
MSLHSCVQLVNRTALPLQLGCVNQAGPHNPTTHRPPSEPLPLEVLGPGDSVWLPLQVGGVVLGCYIGL